MDACQNLPKIEESFSFKPDSNDAKRQNNNIRLSSGLYASYVQHQTVRDEKSKEEQTYSMVRRCQRRHLVPVARVFKIEHFDLLGYLSRRQPCTPFVHQLSEDAIRPTLLHLAQPAKLRQLVVRHPHVGLLSFVCVSARASKKPVKRVSMKPVGREPYLLTSSACTYVSVKGSNSAVGTAVRKLYDRSYIDATFSLTHFRH
jgi:hypothetical protein